MRIGVVSDTHGRAANAQAAAIVLAEHAVEAVLHCGDIGSDDVVRAFDLWPTHFVLGNTDDQPAALERAILAAGQTYHGAFGDLRLGNRRIALLHGDDTRRLKETIASQQYDLVCYGHTHVAATRREGRTLVLNPGALHRAKTYTIAVVDLTELNATHIAVPVTP
ncbi:MAG: YfcE family phosphodiesterase [Planctomycetota bacterium]|nr:MAG: YfcE family phosphodiesterase [Planctomycetota bacterium]